MLFTRASASKSVCIRKVLRPAISTQVFLVFLCLQANAKMVPKCQVPTACFSCSPPDFKLIKITPCCGCRRFNCFFLISIKQSEIQNSAVLSEATPYHHNIFTFTLFLPEGRAGVAWEPSNKMLFLPLGKFGFKVRQGIKEREIVGVTGMYCQTHVRANRRHLVGKDTNYTRYVLGRNRASAIPSDDLDKCAGGDKHLERYY
jgi:hypothetical protein